MNRVVIHSPGGYSKLKLETHPDPVPGPGEVLVQTSAIGVNYADVCIRWGVYESAKKFVGWPITPGFESAGVVRQVGPGVSRVAAGDRVIAISRFNGYATHVVVPEDQIFRVPARFTMEEAAGFSTVFLTAYHALHQNVVIRPGMVALIHSAAGGVGSALVQLARLAQLRTIAVVGSSHKVGYARELGADHVIDKSTQALWNEVERIAPEGVDLIFDANGPKTLKDGFKHLRPTGKLISYGFHGMLPKGRWTSDQARPSMGGHLNYLKALWGLVKMPRFNPLRMTNENKSLVCFNLSFLFERSDLLEEAMTQLLSWAAEGRITPPKIQPFALKDVAQAHRLIESGQSVGKLVLVPSAGTLEDMRS